MRLIPKLVQSKAAAAAVADWLPAIIIPGWDNASREDARSTSSVAAAESMMKSAKASHGCTAAQTLLAPEEACKRQQFTSRQKKSNGEA
ncbi:unnamed protein product [Gongylonema pulchrum]|uniref:Secreted protein n=1 Tax=Gongylonema pulchrum TaxID=637853 RepID=A0A183ETE5_9BILA|nr:unnamed protein product [Gongylonema pulchrum]